MVGVSNISYHPTKTIKWNGLIKVTWSTSADVIEDKTIVIKEDRDLTRIYFISRVLPICPKSVFTLHAPLKRHLTEKRYN